MKSLALLKGHNESGKRKGVDEIKGDIKDPVIT